MDNIKERDTSLGYKKRISLYVFFDINGILHDYMEFYLKELKKISNEVCKEKIKDLIFPLGKRD